MTWSDYAAALRMRDMMQQMMNTEIEKIRPRHQYATVVSFNRITRKCEVQFPGEVSTVWVNMGSIQPKLVGQVVRIDGVLGDRYIGDVLGEPFDLNSRTIRSQLHLTGGDPRITQSGAVGWTGRFVMIGTGMSADAPSGYFSIYMPSDGTVITVHGETAPATVTVASGVIPFTGWRELYYEVPWGQIHSTVGTFHLVGYTSTFDVPSDWVKICQKQTELGTVVWADGRETDYWRTPTLQSSWVNYGGVFETARYMRQNGMTIIQGLVKSGTVGAGNPIFTLPAGFRPRAQIMFPSVGNSAFARIDVLSTGEVEPTVGSTTWTNLTGIAFPAFQ
jgi:hypothetical protein